MRGVRIHVLAVVVALTAAACGGGEAEPATTQQAPGSTTTALSESTTDGEPTLVTSDDGRLTLTVDPGSPGISITTGDAASAGVEDAYQALGIYDLGPDGTVFDTPAVATYDTGLIHEAGDPVPLLAVALENEAGEYEVLSSRVDLTGDTISVTTEVPHFSRLLILGSPDALYLWPEKVIEAVGSRFWAEWDLYDARTTPLTNGADRLEYRRVAWDDEGGLTVIKPLIDGIQIDPAGFATGSVDVVADGFVTTYAYLPTGPKGSEGFGSFVEIFYGDGRFECAAPGLGSFGFDVGVFLPPGSVAFAKRLGNGRAIVVVPSGGATITYEVEGDAVCVDTRYGTVVRIGSRLLHIRQAPMQRFLEGIREDGMHDGIWSISEVIPGVYLPHVDIWDAGMARTRIRSRVLDPLVNFSVFECGTTTVLETFDDLEVSTVCAAEPTPIPAGDVALVVAAYSGPLPIDGDGSEYVYSAVFDSNGDPSDDWQFQGDFDWDFFRDTDRWYQVFIHADGTKEMLVTDTIGPALPSGARALLFEDTVMWIIPMDEFSGTDPRGRVTSFVHDGTYDPATGQGDVIGADPTEPLMGLISLDE